MKYDFVGRVDEIGWGNSEGMLKVVPMSFVQPSPSQQSVERRLCTRHTPITALQWRDSERYGMDSVNNTTTRRSALAISGSSSSIGRRIGSDAGGLGFEFQTGRSTGKSTPSLWRDMHPAIKGLRPPEHHEGKSHPEHNETSE